MTATLMSTMLRLPALRARAFRPYSFKLVSRAVSSVSPPLIRIHDATFYQNYPTAEDEAKCQNPPLFPNLNFELPSKPGADGPQHWAVLGSLGRTEFLDALRGQYICIPPNARSYPYLLTEEIAKKDTRLRYSGNAIQYIGFSGEGSGAIGGTRGAYLSARYESLREETDWTVNQYLRGQTSLNPLEEEKDGIIHDEALLSAVIADLRLEELLDRPVANLSNGQTRRTRIAKALLSKPELLLLDDPFMGLDPATVESISGLLHRLANKSDPRLVLSLRPQDTIPDWITHLLVLGNSNRVIAQGTRSRVQKIFDVWSTAATRGPRNRSNQNSQKVLDQAREDLEAGYLDKQLIWDLQPHSFAPTRTEIVAPRGGEPLIEMHGVQVRYGDTIALGDWEQNVRNETKTGLHWVVRRGQRWVVLGANGSGKTTLLSLITSDHPQAYALPMKLFGRSRLPEPGKPGISIFELQSRIGHSSPEIHAFFPRQLTIRQAIESAFAETFLSNPVLDHDRDLDVSATLRFFKAELDPNFHANINQETPKIPADHTNFPELNRVTRAFFTPLDYEVEYADNVTFGELSTAQQRLILFIRALVHRPDIVILDEPFSGMSGSIRDKCQHFLEVGETMSHRVSTPMRKSGRNSWLEGFKPPADDCTPSNLRADVRFNGLTDQQALIMISHVREEIPDIVRHYMRLPSGDKEDDTHLDFRCGSLKLMSQLRDPKVWSLAWAPELKFNKQSRRAFRRRESSLTVEETGEFDEEVYEWWSI
ncbi:P-loop containing nucleoside triphosphate hydrolase protein [Aspergillus pseudoustus]|uniref:P-loop containing nucleoside triphosphate hydrolase protein n=1 Tax=Aspergillus pseudoustus TaxID=1810923 RepID=A0ABR4JLI9_9EURO